MTGELKGKRVAILLSNGFEQVEMTKPRMALEEAGAITELISPAHAEVQGWNHYEKADHFPVDVELNNADPEQYDALLIPGGVVNSDQLRTYPRAVQFVKRFRDQHKPIAVICHGPWMLVEADVVKGRRVTSWPSLSTDLRNAGANWVDQEVVVDDGIVTSRKPDDLPAFNREMIQQFQRAHQHEPVGAGQKTR